MKRYFILLFTCLGAIAGFAQGQLIFANSGPTAITNWCTGQACAGGPEQNDTQVGLYIGGVGEAVSSLTLSGSVTNFFLPGRFSGGTRTLAGTSAGQTIQIQVRAWIASTVYSSYEA